MHARRPGVDHVRAFVGRLRIGTHDQVLTRSPGTLPSATRLHTDAGEREAERRGGKAVSVVAARLWGMTLVTAQDYAWIRSSPVFRNAIEGGYGLTLVRGIAPSDVLRVMGASRRARARAWTR